MNYDDRSELNRKKLIFFAKNITLTIVTTLVNYMSSYQRR